MQCEPCEGRGWNARLIRNRANIPIGAEHEPCRACGGTGIASCCDGAVGGPDEAANQGQPDLPTRGLTGA